MFHLSTREMMLHDSENQVGENGANAEDGAQDAVEEGRSANAAAAAAAP